MFFVLLSFLSLMLFGQEPEVPVGLSQAPLIQTIDPAACVLELTSDEAEKILNSLNPELRERFLDLARLRVSLNTGNTGNTGNTENAGGSYLEVKQKLFFHSQNELRSLTFKVHPQGDFDLFLRAAVFLVEVKKTDANVQEAQKLEASKQNTEVIEGVLELEKEVVSLRREPKTIKALYIKEPRLFSEHRQKGYFKFDLGLDFLDEAFGLAYSTQLKELIRQIVNAEDLNDEKALALLLEIKPKFKFGEAKQILEFREILKGTSLEAWAKEVMPRLFIDMNRAPTRLGQKLREILWPDSVEHRGSGDKKASLHSSADIREFVIQAIQHPQSDSFWTTQSMVRAFREILQMGHTQEGVRAWLSQPAQNLDRSDSIQAKARYLGLMLNQLDYDNWIALIPASEIKDIEQAIDKFSILRLIRTAIKQEKEKQKKLRWYRGLWGSIPTFEELSFLSLESFEFIKAPIPNGGEITYIMGSPSDEWGRFPHENQRDVILRQAFQFGSTKITQWLYKRIMDDKSQKARFDWGQASFNHGMDSISAIDAEEFAKELTAFLKKIDPNHPCRYELSTEARREYMARGDTKTPFSFGRDLQDLGDYGYYIQNSNNQTHPVTDKLPNGFGVYGVHGDLLEWQQDRYTETPLGGIDPVTQALVNLKNSLRSLRGGSWFNSAEPLRSAHRTYYLSGDRSGDRSDYMTGARLVRICEE